MPIYEYECPVCGRFELMQKISEAALEVCPTCQGAGRQSSVQRVVSASAFHLKGSGWYKTDYSSSGSSGSSAKTAPKDASAGTSEAKSEAKSTESKSSDSGGDTGSGGKKGGCGGGCTCH